MKLGKIILAMAAASVLLGMLVGTASARNLSASAQAITVTWARFDLRANFGTVECEVTVEGSFHERTIAKTSGSLTGYVTGARVSPRCRRGEATVLTETLPWHVQYDNFTGTLPTITSIRARVIGLAFRSGLFGISCLSRSALAEPATITFNREAGGVISSATAGGAIRTTCGDVGTLSGTSNSLSSLRVTLI